MAIVARRACSSWRTTATSRRPSSARCAWRATRCGSPATAWSRSSRRDAFAPDLVVLDLGLPRMDGVDVARQLRGDGDVPILMLTARDAWSRASRAWTPAPTTTWSSPSTARSCWPACAPCCAAARPAASAPLVVGDLMLNPDTHEVRRGERAIDLTQREFELLEYLMRNERIVISRQQLLDEVWGYDPFSITNTIEVFVSNLRRKLEAGGEPRLLHTIRGAGYVLRV